MGGIQDFRKMSDQEILGAIEQRLGQHHVEEFITTVPFYQLELTRRSIVRLRESSGRLEVLTKVLIGATVILLLVALPPAVEIVTRLLSR